jgi:hypothetical protein
MWKKCCIIRSWVYFPNWFRIYGFKRPSYVMSSLLFKPITIIISSKLSYLIFKTTSLLFSIHQHRHEKAHVSLFMCGRINFEININDDELLKTIRKHTKEIKSRQGGFCSLLILAQILHSWSLKIKLLLQYIP